MEVVLAPVILISPCWSQLQVGGLTAASGSNYDFSLGSALKVPVAAGATAAASGSIIFDSTASNLHSFLNGADAVLGGFTSTPTTGDVVSATVSAGNVRLSDAGFLATTVVKGAGNLATGGNPGPVPYVSAAGTLSEDASNFCWDATNHRFGINNCAPTVPLDITTQSGGSVTPLRIIGGVNQNLTALFSTPTSGFGNLMQFTTASTNWQFGSNRITTDNSFGIYSSSANTELLHLQLTGAVGIGIGNVNMSSLTTSILDRTATTGATNVYVGSDNNGHISATTTRFNIALGTSDSATTAIVVNAGTTKSAGYQSSDGSAGVTGATCTAWKNGLCTSL